MNSYLKTGALLAVCFTLAGQAQETNRFRVGAHGTYSMGGDVEESQAGFGAQAEIDLTKNVGVELSVSRFSDEDGGEGISIDQDLTTIGLSIVGRATLVEKLNGFVLAGMDYNMADADVAIDPAAYGGIPMTAKLDIDDSVGFHMGIGLNVPIQKNWELFLEFRYTFLDMEGQVAVTATETGITESRDAEGDYDFGLLKAGVNFIF